MGRSIDRPIPSTQNRRLFSRSALGIIGMHDSTFMIVSDAVDPNTAVEGLKC
jgi:hypothetical protein